MSLRRPTRRALVTALALLAAALVCQAAEPPVNIIFDTDMGDDCDDVGALFILSKKPGTSTITATIDNAKQACTVIVTPSTLPNGWSYHELCSGNTFATTTAVFDSITVTRL